MGEASNSSERAKSELKLEFEKEKAMIERNLKNKMRILEEKLIKGNTHFRLTLVMTHL